MGIDNCRDLLGHQWELDFPDLIYDEEENVNNQQGSAFHVASNGLMA